MKLHRLELEGFGPFRHRQVVDFDAFDDDGIFLISGRTGAGKSSILDGVCFALYGMVPRYEGAGKRLRSDHSAPDEPTQVVLEFSAHARRYRIARSPEYERPKARGTGMTPEKARVEVSVRDGSGWRGLTTNAKEAGALIADEIVGLTGAQFLQVILLAQNKFADFLLAGNDDRQALLRNLFGSRTYVDYEAALEQRRRDSQKAFDAHGSEVEFLLTDAERYIDERGLGPADEEENANGGDSPPGRDDSGEGAPRDTDTRLDDVERAIRRAAYAEEQARFAQETATEHRAVAQRAHVERVAMRETQLKRRTARDELAVLNACADEIDLTRRELAAANAGEALRASLDAVRGAEQELQSRADAAHAHSLRWDALGEDPAIGEDALDAMIDALTGDLRLWETAASREQTLHELEGAVAAVDARISELEREIAAADSRRERSLSSIPALESDIAPLEGVAARRETLDDAVDALIARHAAAQEAERRALEARVADEHHAAEAAAYAAAVADVSALLQRRLDGAAAELASRLVDGAPCTVCGSTAHPAPASAAHAHVTDADIDEAQRSAETARVAAAEASATAQTAHTRLADVRARSDDATVADIEQRLVAAQAAARAAADAETRAATLRADLARERDELEKTDTERAAAATLLASAREERAGHSAGIAAARADVIAARGDFDSIGERVAAGTRRRDAARALRDSRDALATATRAHSALADDVAARVAASAFADIDDVRRALRSERERAALDSRVREHEADLAARREALRQLELDLAGAPDEIVGVDDTQALLTAAEDAHVRAAALATTAASTTERLRDVHGRARSAHARTAEAAAAHRVIVGLADAVAGRNAKKMDLETFVLAAELEQIVVAAARRLEEMSGGRYRLRHTDALAARNRASGLGLEIVDAHTGTARPPQSLSGGETFLASLALALGLAEVVTARAGGVSLDTLFIDEGFGSLDAETLETAMSTLDELRQGGRTVGIISHVAAMKERIPARVEVRASAQGASTIHQGASTIHQGASAIQQGASATQQGAP